MNTEELLEKIPETKTNSEETLRKILFDNDQATVIETDYTVKGTVPFHEHHFPYVLYSIDGGTVEITDAAGKSSVLEMQPGQVYWRNAQSHSARNVGPEPFKIVEVEVKNGTPAIQGERVPYVSLPHELKWEKDKIDPLRKAALLVGDPSQPGPYVVRYHVGSGYSFGLHKHPTEDEYLTIISGSVHWSTGLEGSLEPEHILPAGGFVLFPAGTPHRLWTTEETVLQINGIGPRIYEFVGDGQRVDS
ncbi:MAG TPA: cupin domain-containing protein [Hanamia sp.]|nr:cupin domain-containing protein [Hanamia sp.]